MISNVQNIKALPLENGTKFDIHLLDKKMFLSAILHSKIIPRHQIPM